MRIRSITALLGATMLVAGTAGCSSTTGGNPFGQQSQSIATVAPPSATDTAPTDVPSDTGTSEQVPSDEPTEPATTTATSPATSPATLPTTSSAASSDTGGAKQLTVGQTLHGWDYSEDQNNKVHFAMTVTGVTQHGAADVAGSGLQVPAGKQPYFLQFTIKNTDTVAFDPTRVDSSVRVKDKSGTTLVPETPIPEVHDCPFTGPDTLAPGKQVTDCRIFVMSGQQIAGVVYDAFGADGEYLEATWAVS